MLIIPMANATSTFFDIVASFSPLFDDDDDGAASSDLPLAAAGHIADLSILSVS
jgi:hypothetical protein